MAAEYDLKILAEKEAELVAAKAKLAQATREDRSYREGEVRRLEERLVTLRRRAGK